MALDIWIWATAGVTAAFSITFVWMIYYFIVPIRGSFARHVVRAKREKKPIFFLDAGKFFRCVVGDDQIGQEKGQVMRANNGMDVIKMSPTGGLKYCESVMVGIGEDFRSIIANTAIMELMETINEKDWTTDQIDELLTKVIDTFKNDLGIVDPLKKAKLDLDRDLEKINKHYDKQKEDLIRMNEPVGVQHGQGDNEETGED